MPKPEASPADVGAARAPPDGRRRAMNRPTHATVRFLESARIYRMPRTNPDYAASLRSLQAAAGTGVAVCVRLTALHSEIIVSVRANC